MRTIFLAGVAALALFATACSGDQDAGEAHAADAVPTEGDPQLSAAAAKAAGTHGVPSIAVARLSLDRGTVAGVAGTRGHRDSTAVTMASRFHLGSNTKAMTAVLVAQLVEAGSLSFDTKITEALPDAAVHADLTSVTIRDVLGHRSGLGDDFDLQALHDASDAVTARHDAVREALRSPLGEPGNYAYANVNYMLAGAVVETIAGAQWNDIIEQNLFAPLQMTTCGFGAPLGDLDPLGHTADGTPIPQDAPVTDNPAAMAPAGTVHCSIEDWAKFATTMLDLLTGTDTEILAAATAADLFAGDDAYVAGWVRSGRDGDVTYGHDGSNTLWYARAVLRPAQRDAVLVAANTGEAAAVRAIDDLTESVLRD